MLANLNRAIALARRQHMPVIFIQHDSGPGSDLARDSEAWRLHPALARQDGDAVVHKRFSDSFQHTTLTELLRGDDIDELWLAGSATEFCVDSTLRSAMSQEYSVTLIADAHTCKPRPQLNAEQVIDHFNWVWSNLDETPKPLRVRGIAELESGAVNENRRARPAVSLAASLLLQRRCGRGLGRRLLLGRGGVLTHFAGGLQQSALGVVAVQGPAEHLLPSCCCTHYVIHSLVRMVYAAVVASCVNPAAAD